MKYIANIKIFIILLIVLSCFSTAVFASSSTSFPNDPRQNPLPAGVRPSTQINSDSGVSGIQSSESLFRNLNDYSKNKLAKNNNFQENTTVKLLIPLLLAFIVICFLVVIFFVARNIFFSS